VYANLSPETGKIVSFVSGHTYQGHSIDCAAALAVQTIMKRDRLKENIKSLGSVMEIAFRSNTTSSINFTSRGMALFRTVDFWIKWQ